MLNSRKINKMKNQRILCFLTQSNVLQTVGSKFVSLVHHAMYFSLLFATVFAIWPCTDVDIFTNIA